MGAMSWWPFKRKSKVLDEEPHLRGTRMWIQDLREACERHFDDHVGGHQAVSDIPVSYTHLTLPTIYSV